MAIPTQVPTWATDATGIANTTAPSGTKQNDGWAVGDTLPAQYLNWFFNLVGQWCTYLNTFLSTANVWTAAQTFSAGIAGGLNISGGLGVTGGLTSDTLAAPNSAAYRLSAPQTNIIDILAPYFAQTDNTNAPSLQGGAGGPTGYGAYKGSITAGASVVFAKVYVPAGATITDVKTLYYNTDAAAKVPQPTLSAAIYNPAGGYTSQTLAGPDFPSLASGASGWQTSTITVTPVVPSDSQVSLVVQLPATTAANGLRFYGARISYTQPTLTPPT